MVSLASDLSYGTPSSPDACSLLAPPFDLYWADLYWAALYGADLYRADLYRAEQYWAEQR